MTTRVSAPPLILIVEDSPVAAELLCRTLARAGYAVSVAQDGAEGLQAAQAHRPALVMSDINMPLMNGYQLCRAIKTDDELWNVPLMLLTVLAEPEDIIEAINSGADAYIVKPFAETDLLGRIRSLLDTPIERRQTEERRDEVVEYGGKHYTIAAGGKQVLNLMLSLYENMLNLSRELVAIQTELNLLNESLDAQVRERTAALVHVNRALRVLSTGNRLLARAKSEEELIRTSVRNIVDQGGYGLARICYAANDPEKSLTCMASADSGKDLHPTEPLTWADTNEGQVPTVLAIRSGKVQVSRDIASDPGFEPWKKAALACGYTENIALPLTDSGRVFGALSIYSSEAIAFDDEETRLLGEMAGDIAYGIVSQRARGALGAAEQALREGEENFRQLFEGSRDALMVAKPPSWRFTEVNQAALQLFGAASKADLTALGPWDLSPERQPDGRSSKEKGRELGAIVLREGSSLFEWELRRLNGETFTASVLGTRMEARGQVFLQATVRDISKGKQAELKLRESERKYRQLFESSRDALMLLKPPSWRFTDANQATLKMFGAASTVEFTALGPWAVSPELQPDGRPSAEKAQEMIASAVREGSHFFEWEHQRLDGEPFAADVLLTRMEEDGQVYLQGTVRDISERKREEQALAESKVLLGTIFDSVQDGIVLADVQTKQFRMVNAAMSRMLGYSRDELLNLRVQDIHPEQALASVAREFERLAKGGIGLSQNMPVKRKDGTVFYADLNSGPMLVNGVACLVGVFRDITERKLTENVLIESENRLRTVLESVQAGIVIIDPEVHKIIDVNPFAARMIGAPRENIIGAECHKFICPAERGKCPATDLHQTIDNSERVLLTATGDKREIIKTVTTIHISGRPHLLESFIDITERKQAEQALQESEERFKSIVENVAEMFFIMDGSLHAEYVSPRCLEIYGYSSAEMTARETLWMEAIHPDDRAAVWSHAEQEVRSGARSINEYRILRKDGSVRWVRNVSNPMLGADGQLQRIYGTVVDITEFESLRSSLKEKEMLLKEIHHRVKNNLQIIISLMRLESRAFSEERIQAVLKDLETRIRAMALVHEHLYHSSDLARIGFKDYLKGLCEELFRTYGADGGRIRMEIDAEAVVLDIERAIPCGLIINELLTNAIKHAFPGDRKGVLRVAIRNTPDNEVEILVSDDGIGIPETLDIRHAKSLGLELVFTLAENQLKGRVELERASGTRFRIRFRT